MEIGIARIDRLIVHRVGNKSREEGLECSGKEVLLTPELTSIIVNDLIRGTIKSGVECEFFHESRLELNEIHKYAEEIFEDPSNFEDSSESIAKHLYSKSTHPHVAGGDLIIVLIDKLVDGDKEKRAIALFKLEVESQFIAVLKKGRDYLLKDERGMDPKKLQKAALIICGENRVFAVESGYSVTKYWMADFLKVRRRTTPKAAGSVAAKVVRRAISGLESVEDRVEYKRDVDELLGRDSISLSEISELNEGYFGKERATSIMRGAIEEVGVTIKESKKMGIDIGQFKKEVGNHTRRVSLAEGLDIIAGSGMEIVSIKRKKSSDEEEITLKVKKRKIK